MDSDMETVSYQDIKEFLRACASKGGKVRAKKLSAKRRTEIALMGVKAKAEKRKRETQNDK